MIGLKCPKELTLTKPIVCAIVLFTFTGTLLT